MPGFDDIRDLHLVYDYDAKNEAGEPEKWRYEAWFVSETRVVCASIPAAHGSRRRRHPRWANEGPIQVRTTPVR